jgi:DNA uptake protein ComE-like DNA-binding protein
MLKQLAAVALTLALGAGTALAQTTTPAPVTATPATPPAAAKAAAPAVQPAAKTVAVDINSASAKDLAKLPGVDDAKAAAIVKGRPYKGTDELVQKKIVSDTVFAQIRNQITVKQN